MSSRWFLTRIVTRLIDGDEVTGPALDLVRGPGGAPFWPDGTRKRYAEATANGWALVIVDVSLAGRATVPVPADPDVYAMPDFSLDAKVSAMHGPTKNAMSSFIGLLGMSTSWIANADGYREVIRTLGRSARPDFDENSFGTF